MMEPGQFSLQARSRRSELTQLRHGRLKTFAAQKHCSFLR